MDRKLDHNPMGCWVSRVVKGFLGREDGVTMLELVVALGIGALLTSVLASTVLVLLWLPGERRDRVTVAQDVQNAEHWITRDANSANNFLAGSSPTYGVFSWSDYTGDTQLNYQVTYSYDAANGYLMRTEQQNGVPASTMAVGKNIASENDVVFAWNASTYSVQVSLTSTVMTGTSKEGITTTVRSGLGTMAARYRSEPLTSPPGSLPIPPPPPGSEEYYGATEPEIVTGNYVTGSITNTVAVDNSYYCVESTVGGDKEAVYILQHSQSMTVPATISQIMPVFVGKADKQRVTISFYVKDSDAGFPAIPESGFTFTEREVIVTSYFILSPNALSYALSQPDRRVTLLIEATADPRFTLCYDLVQFIASP